jgi:aminoglycoside 6'-N-acetyltransferase I
MSFLIRLAQSPDVTELAKMRALLWPDGSLAEHEKELSLALGGKAVSTLPTATFVAASEDGALIGFLEAGLRSHADGCDTTRLVGFVEGWFVHEEFRGRGVGEELMRAAEDWARSNGCREMASDALIDNDASIQVHQALGFEIVDRCVHFRKSL